MLPADQAAEQAHHGVDRQGEQGQGHPEGEQGAVLARLTAPQSVTAGCCITGICLRRMR